MNLSSLGKLGLAAQAALHNVACEEAHRIAEGARWLAKCDCLAEDDAVLASTGLVARLANLLDHSAEAVRHAVCTLVAHLSQTAGEAIKALLPGSLMAPMVALLRGSTSSSQAAAEALCWLAAISPTALDTASACDAFSVALAAALRAASQAEGDQGTHAAATHSVMHACFLLLSKAPQGSSAATDAAFNIATGLCDHDCSPSSTAAWVLAARAFYVDAATDAGCPTPAAASALQAGSEGCTSVAAMLGQAVIRATARLELADDSMQELPPAGSSAALEAGCAALAAFQALADSSTASGVPSHVQQDLVSAHEAVAHKLCTALQRCSATTTAAAAPTTAGRMNMALRAASRLLAPHGGKRALLPAAVQSVGADVAAAMRLIADGSGQALLQLSAPECELSAGVLCELWLASLRTLLASYGTSAAGAEGKVQQQTAQQVLQSATAVLLVLLQQLAGRGSTQAKGVAASMADAVQQAVALAASQGMLAQLVPKVDPVVRGVLAVIPSVGADPIPPPLSLYTAIHNAALALGSSAPASRTAAPQDTQQRAAAGSPWPAAVSSTLETWLTGAAGALTRFLDSRPDWVPADKPLLVAVSSAMMRFTGICLTTDTRQLCRPAIEHLFSAGSVTRVIQVAAATVARYGAAAESFLYSEQYWMHATDGVLEYLRNLLRDQADCRSKLRDFGFVPLLVQLMEVLGRNINTWLLAMYMARTQAVHNTLRASGAISAVTRTLPKLAADPATRFTSLVFLTFLCTGNGGSDDELATTTLVDNDVVRCVAEMMAAARSNPRGTGGSPSVPNYRQHLSMLSDCVRCLSCNPRHAQQLVAVGAHTTIVGLLHDKHPSLVAEPQLELWLVLALFNMSQNTQLVEPLREAGIVAVMKPFVGSKDERLADAAKGCLLLYGELHDDAAQAASQASAAVVAEAGQSSGHAYDVFLSHKRTDAKDFARALYNLFVLRGYSTFLDYEYREELTGLGHEVSGSANLIFILTDNVFKSSWCIKELQAAVKHGTNVILLTKEGSRWEDEHGHPTCSFPPNHIVSQLPADVQPVFTAKSVAHSDEYYQAFVEQLLHKVRKAIPAAEIAAPEARPAVTAPRSELAFDAGATRSDGAITTATPAAPTVPGASQQAAITRPQVPLQQQLAATGAVAPAGTSALLTGAIMPQPVGMPTPTPQSEDMMMMRQAQLFQMWMAHANMAQAMSLPVLQPAAAPAAAPSDQLRSLESAVANMSLRLQDSLNQLLLASPQRGVPLQRDTRADAESVHALLLSQTEQQREELLRVRHRLLEELAGVRLAVTDVRLQVRQLEDSMSDMRHMVAQMQGSIAALHSTVLALAGHSMLPMPPLPGMGSWPAPASQHPSMAQAREAWPRPTQAAAQVPPPMEARGGSGTTMTSSAMAVEPGGLPPIQGTPVAQQARNRGRR